MKKALVIIDMQIMPFIWKDYGGKTLYTEEVLIANTKQLIEKARNADAPIYYVMYTEKGESPRAEGQPLWQVHPEIAPQERDKLVVKYYADSFLQTKLETLLNQQGIKNIVLCGIQTEFCVDTTCKSAFSHGFNIELAADCHSTFDSDLLLAKQIIAHHNSILSQFAQVKPVSEIEME
ncbi:cysteine hydrolase family protein [Sinanaerobacter chloroacetimidivorans]|jgi:nicotinamidase-related amidase|uniref:Cysteine hydrolase n=1 Tax=Sinanaerobacter chloroacetimidivorans TaxID=2818044 RepID=A0A8J8B0U1_9FIRM|nr:cysteine hydrolase family protein [Sinanaerobacter chloroacetimidivorans]MBR0596981.1 cysteine hydrolase [Sinanaerobacter chloroacetimidivorans]